MSVEHYNRAIMLARKLLTELESLSEEELLVFRSCDYVSDLREKLKRSLSSQTMERKMVKLYHFCYDQGVDIETINFEKTKDGRETVSAKIIAKII